MRALAFLLLLPIAAQAQTCNLSCVARRAEAHLLRRGVTERHGDRLVVYTGPGRMVFEDQKQACDWGNAQVCAIYDVVASPPGTVAIRKFGFEGSDCWLIDMASGRKTMLTGVPVFSPDGSRFVITDFSNNSDNNLEVWMRDGMRLEWAHPSKQSFAEDPALLRYPSDPRLALPPVFQVTGWQGDRIALAVSTEDRKRHWAGSLTRDSEGWHLSAKSPPGLLNPE